MYDQTGLDQFISQTMDTLTGMSDKQDEGSTAHHRLDGALMILKKVQERLPSLVVSTEKTSMSRIVAEQNVRKFDPQTSWEAAVSVDSSESRQQLYRNIYWALTEGGPQTDDELRHFLARHGLNVGGHASVAKRRGELVKAGWIEKTSQRRPSDVGASMTVWAAVQSDIQSEETAA